MRGLSAIAMVTYITDQLQKQSLSDGLNPLFTKKQFGGSSEQILCQTTCPPTNDVPTSSASTSSTKSNTHIVQGQWQASFLPACPPRCKSTEFDDAELAAIGASKQTHSLVWGRSDLEFNSNQTAKRSRSVESVLPPHPALGATLDGAPIVPNFSVGACESTDASTTLASEAVVGRRGSQCMRCVHNQHMLFCAACADSTPGTPPIDPPKKRLCRSLSIPGDSSCGGRYWQPQASSIWKPVNHRSSHMKHVRNARHSPHVLHKPKARRPTPSPVRCSTGYAAHQFASSGKGCQQKNTTGFMSLTGASQATQSLSALKFTGGSADNVATPAESPVPRPASASSGFYESSASQTSLNTSWTEGLFNNSGCGAYAGCFSPNLTRHQLGHAKMRSWSGDSDPFPSAQATTFHSSTSFNFQTAPSTQGSRASWPWAHQPGNNTTSKTLVNAESMPAIFSSPESTAAHSSTSNRLTPVSFSGGRGWAGDGSVPWSPQSSPRRQRMARRCRSQPCVLVPERKQGGLKRRRDDLARPCIDFEKMSAEVLMETAGPAATSVHTNRPKSVTFAQEIHEIGDSRSFRSLNTDAISILPKSPMLDTIPSSPLDSPQFPVPGLLQVHAYSHSASQVHVSSSAFASASPKYVYAQENAPQRLLDTPKTPTPMPATAAPKDDFVFKQPLPVSSPKRASSVGVFNQNSVFPSKANSRFHIGAERSDSTQKNITYSNQIALFNNNNNVAGNKLHPQPAAKPNVFHNSPVSMQQSNLCRPVAVVSTQRDLDDANDLTDNPVNSMQSFPIKHYCYQDSRSSQQQQHQQHPLVANIAIETSDNQWDRGCRDINDPQDLLSFGESENSYSCGDHSVLIDEEMTTQQFDLEMGNEIDLEQIENDLENNDNM